MDQTRLDRLIEKYADGTATPEELEELFDWYRSASIETVEWPAESPDEKEQLQNRMLQRLQRQMHPAGAQAPLRSAGSRSTLKRLYGWRAAASLIVIVASFWIARLYLHHTDKPGFDSTVSNPHGKILAITLPDSSRVWLNAASTLRYASAFSKHREIYLEGEAYFDVTTDADHPFVVHAGSLTTTVLGTSFDIKSFTTEQETFVSVIRGKVQVQDSSKVLDILTPARQLQSNSRTGQARTINIDTNQVVGWQQGRLQFSGQTMEEIAASLGRWYNVQILFSNPATRKCRYYLNFENTISLTNLLTVLGESTGMTFRIDEKDHTVILTGEECR